MFGYILIEPSYTPTYGSGFIQFIHQIQILPETLNKKHYQSYVVDDVFNTKMQSTKNFFPFNSRKRYCVLEYKRKKLFVDFILVLKTSSTTHDW